MPITNIPERYFASRKQQQELFVYDFKMTEDAVNSKVNLTLHMFSFLRTGEKKVRVEDSVVEVNNKQSVLIKSGNCLMTELLSNNEIYFCKLFFFTNKNILDFLEKHEYLVKGNGDLKIEKPFFVIENDDFINSLVSSITSLLQLKPNDSAPFMSVKFEEIMLYLSHKYGGSFINYIKALSAPEENSSLKKIVEASVYSSLNLSEIAFLANMSLSTFKRHFEKEYNANPGKWLQQKRLGHAKKLLEETPKKPMEIYADLGYTNFSNFSTAFKKEFGFSPKNCKQA